MLPIFFMGKRFTFKDMQVYYIIHFINCPTINAISFHLKLNSVGLSSDVFQLENPKIS